MKTNKFLIILLLITFNYFNIFSIGKIISFSFKGSSTTPYLSLNEIAGVAPAANWNSTGVCNSETKNLITNEGDITNVSIYNNFGSNYSNTTSTLNSINSPNGKIFKGSVGHTSNITKYVEIRSLPIEFTQYGYDVYVYYINKDNTTRNIKYICNGTTFWLKSATPGWDGAYKQSVATSTTNAVADDNYVLFTNQTNDTCRINITNSELRGGVCAIQVVARDNPNLAPFNISLKKPANNETILKDVSYKFEAEVTVNTVAPTKVGFFIDEKLIGYDTNASDGWTLDYTPTKASQSTCQVFGYFNTTDSLGSDKNILTIKSNELTMVEPSVSWKNEGDNMLIKASYFEATKIATTVKFYYYSFLSENDTIEIGTATKASNVFSLYTNKFKSGLYYIFGKAFDSSMNEICRSTAKKIGMKSLTPKGTVISVNISGTGPVMHKNDIAGVIPCENWCNINANNKTSELLNDQGEYSGAKVVADWFNTDYKGFCETITGNGKMMNGVSARTDGNKNNIDFSGIPAEITKNGYDVYVYWLNHTNVDRKIRLEIGSQKKWMYQNNVNWDGIFSESTATTELEVEAALGKNYVIFQNLTGSSFSLNHYSLDPFRGGISGIQIVARKEVFFTHTASSYAEGKTIQLSATTSILESEISKVEFIINGNKNIQATKLNDKWVAEWIPDFNGKILVLAKVTKVDNLISLSDPQEITILPKPKYVIELSGIVNEQQLIVNTPVSLKATLSNIIELPAFVDFYFASNQYINTAMSATNNEWSIVWTPTQTGSNIPVWAEGTSSDGLTVVKSTVINVNIVVPNTGLNEMDFNEKFNVTTNQKTKTININNTSSEKIVSIKLYSISGVEMKSENFHANTFEFSDLESGCYILSINCMNKQFSKKIIL